jgi:hypothetical protein
MKRATVIALFIVGFSGILSACTSDEGPNGSDGGPSDSGIDASDVRVDTRQDTGPPDAEPDTEPDMGPDVEPDTRPDTDETGEDSGTDTGPNCSLDTDADGLDNCAEAELCTSPTDGDTDNDGISDFEELEEGTDPCNPDTDNDGADDPVELEVGLNPNKPSTFDDGILDENRWRVNACAAPEDPDEDFTGTIDYYESDKANYKIGLPPGFSNYEQLTLGNDAPIAAGVYGDSLTSVYGFIVSKNAEGGRTAPDQSLRDTVRPEVIEIAGNDQDNLIFGTNGGAFTTHDGKRAAIGRYLIETPTDKSTAKVREELLLGLDAFGKTDLVGGSSLPSTAGQAHGTFRIFVSVVFRANTSGPSQALVSAAVTPASVYDSRNQVRFQMDDLTNTTNISEEVDGTLVGCETFLPSSDIPKANFYWVLDQSTSMDPDNATVASFGQSFVNQVQNTQLDYSLGVTNMDPGNNGRLYNPWTTNAQQFSSDIQNGVISCTGWSCDCCDEYGLEVAMKGIRYMRGLTPQSPPPVEKIPSDASLITIFMTDEPANSVQDGVSEQTYLDFYTGPGDTTVFSITGTQDCGADGPAYQNVALATGGKFASVCSGDLTGILSDIIFAATGESTEYQLSETPVSASLSVFQESDQDPTTSQFVPRNREDGFEYFAQDNSVAFFGSYRPEPSDGDYSEDFVAVRYEYFIDRCKESGNGANNCADD